MKRKSDEPVVAASVIHATALGPDNMRICPAERAIGFVHGSGSTVSVTEPVRPPDVASMVAWPVATPVTTPEPETVATVGVRLRHSTTALVIFFPLWSN